MNYEKEFENLQCEYEKLDMERHQLSANFHHKVWGEVEKLRLSMG